MTRVLGIETSCDETSASVLSGSGDDVTLESLVILSQDVHRIFGGVVPELASRQHLTALVPVVTSALREAKVELADIDAVAVTNAPGLVGALLVSGGHTLLLDVEAWGRYRLLGRTRDDAAGEAFDKVAKLVGLPYPGGPHVERLARGGDPSRFRFARPMLRRNQQPHDGDYYDVSFSGLKTAVLMAVRNGSPADHADIARGFHDALVETLVEKTARAVAQYDRTRVVLGGGVAGNRTLVAAMHERMTRYGAAVFAPSARLATDNAAMIARAGLFHYERGERAALGLNAFASLPLPGLVHA